MYNGWGGKQVNTGFGVAEVREDLNKSSNIILREDLFCRGSGCLNIWPKHPEVNPKHGKNKQEKAITNVITW